MPGGYFFKALGQWRDYSSRARRTEFWMFTFVAWLLEVMAVAITAMVLNNAYDSETLKLDTAAVTPVGWICIAVTFALAIALFFPFLAVTVRRLHDIGRSGGWAIFLFFLPIVVWILALIDGQPMMNKYGADPKGRDVTKEY